MIELKNVCKEYKINHKNSIEGLSSVNLKIQQGEYVAITGKSGAGKSTLLNIIGGLDKITTGEYYFQDEIIKQDNKSLAEFRYKHIGIIVQNYGLINYKNVFYNIALPLVYNNTSKNEIASEVKRWADYLDISDKLECMPTQLSGGQCQRVAIARALCKKPSVLLADEPTGALDYENKLIVLDILKKLKKDGVTIILATHDYDIVNDADRIIQVVDGKIVV